MAAKCTHRRKYENREGTAPDGRIFVLETCAKCGAVRMVAYKNSKDAGNDEYFQVGCWRERGSNETAQ